MSSRQSTDTISASGLSYNAGNASTAGTVVRNIALSKGSEASTSSVLAKRWPNPIEVWSDGAVFDTVTGKFLMPGTDFTVGELQRR
jgi:hypothetical protein